jgi:DNA-binding transcriptional ArsR family regulator
MEKFVVMSLEDENSRKLAKVLSNETAIKVLNKLAEKRHSATELAKLLSIPVSTMQYNLDLLKESGMIKETAYRYSEKGKRVSYYEPVKKFIIIAPEKEKTSVLNMIKNNIMIPVSLLLAAVVGLGLQPFFNMQQPESLAAGVAVKAAECIGGDPYGECGTPLAAITAPATIEPWLIFLIGGIVTIIIMLLLSYIKNRIRR